MLKTDRKLRSWEVKPTGFTALDMSMNPAGCLRSRHRPQIYSSTQSLSPTTRQAGRGKLSSRGRVKGRKLRNSLPGVEQK